MEIGDAEHKLSLPDCGWPVDRIFTIPARDPSNAAGATNSARLHPALGGSLSPGVCWPIGFLPGAGASFGRIDGVGGVAPTVERRSLEVKLPASSSLTASGSFTSCARLHTRNVGECAGLQRTGVLPLKDLALSLV